MTQVFTRAQIESVIQLADVIPAIEAGFALYTEGKVIVPPVGHLELIDPPGDVHIKYGYIPGDDYYVIKIASGFYDNHKIGLPVSDGSMLVYNQHTGQLLAVLLDEGYLTDLRTGAAGAVAAKHLAPHPVTRIGMIGTGVQARFQLNVLAAVLDCRDVLAYGRDAGRLAAYQADMQNQGFLVETTQDLAAVPAACNLIVTTTPAKAPLLFADQIQPGTHITAVGSDGPGKQELDPAILQKAAVVAADSLPQCAAYGETARAVNAGLRAQAEIVELGAIINGTAPGRTSNDQITVADLTGVAIQDIQIAKLAYQALVS